MRESRNNLSETDPASWQRCPQGIVHQMLAENSRRSRRQLIKTIGWSAITLVAGSGAAAFLLTRNQLPRGVSCTTVMENLEAFHLHELDALTTQSIQNHLANCPPCLELYREKFGQRTA